MTKGKRIKRKKTKRKRGTLAGDADTDVNLGWHPRHLRADRAQLLISEESSTNRKKV